MEWQDEGIVLGIRQHGENNAIAEMMTRSHGRHLGLVRGGRSRRMQPLLQPGNSLSLNWRARLDEHLGTYRLEPVELRAARLMETATAIYGVQAMASLLRLLPERDPHPKLYQAMHVILDNMHEPVDAGELYVRFELAILDDLGFGLDLTRCAATGSLEDLAFVSPKTGRAVGRQAGQPWADRLLVLPEFLSPGARLAADRDSMEQAFLLTGYFFERHVYEPRGIAMPDSRSGFVHAALKAMTHTHATD